MEAIIGYKKTRPLIHTFINHQLITIQKRPIVKKKAKKKKVQAVRIPMVNRVVIPFENLPSKVQTIIEIVSLHMNSTPAKILSESRLKPIVEARHIAMYLCHELITDSEQEIGKWFNRDHSTIYNAIERVNAYKDTEKKYLLRFNKIKSKVEYQFGENNLPDNQ